MRDVEKALASGLVCAARSGPGTGTGSGGGGGGGEGDRDKAGNTLLIAAAQGGNVALVRALLDKHGADVNASNRRGNTALHYAVAYHGSGQHRKKQNSGRTATAGGGHMSLVDLLLQYGADQTAQNADGLAPFEGLRARRDETFAAAGRGRIEEEDDGVEEDEKEVAEEEEEEEDEEEEEKEDKGEEKEEHETKRAESR